MRSRGCDYFVGPGSIRESGTCEFYDPAEPPAQKTHRRCESAAVAHRRQPRARRGGRSGARAGVDVRGGVPVHGRAPPVGHEDQPGRDRLRRGRYHRAEPDRATRGQPCRGRPGGDPGARAQRRALGRGPQLLQQPGLLGERIRPRGPRQRARQGDRRRRLHHHPAVREERARRRRPDRHPQDAGTGDLDEDGQAVVQGRDPAGIPEHHLLRPRRLRHRRRRAGVLRQAGR